MPSFKFFTLFNTEIEKAQMTSTQHNFKNSVTL